MMTFRSMLLAASMLAFFASPALADEVGVMEKLINQPQAAVTSTATTTTVTSAPVAAQPAAVKSVESDTIRLTPDSSKVIHLDKDAASVVVANPQHASVVLDNPRLIVIMPKQPGSTSLTVLDANGQTILEKRILITGTQAKYVRVRRMCSSNDSSCTPSSYFYCPDGCYEVAPVPASDSLADIPEVQGSAAQSQSAPGAQTPTPPALPAAGAVDDGAEVVPPRKEPQ